MKKLTLFHFLLLAAFLPQVGWCQHYNTSVIYPHAVKSAIIRSYDHPATVSYIEISTKHYFAYADASMQVINAEIDSNIFVKDLQIHDHYAYFCGYNFVSGHAVWGWFDINDLAASNFSYSIYDDFSCNGQMADTLYSIAVYRENGDFHVAAVGSTTDGIAKKSPCLIDITGTEGSVGGWSYRMGIPTCEYDFFSFPTKICVTDNLVVTTGYFGSYFYSVSEGYHVHYRSDLFLPGGPQDSLYVFPANILTYPGEDHNGRDIQMTHTTYDNIAVATYSLVYPDTVVQVTGVLVCEYDMAAVISTYAAPSLFAVHSNIPMSNYQLRGLTYSDTYNELILLLSGDFVYPGSGSIVAELPIPPAGSCNSTFIPDQTFTSLDNYNSSSSFVVQGYDTPMSYPAVAFTQPLSSASLCGMTFNPTLYPHEYAAKSYYCPYSFCSDKFDCTEYTKTPILKLVNDIKCSSR